jgi:hypothetical protein
MKEDKMSDSKKVNKRLDSTKKYIDALQENNSKLNVVRVDLAYKKPHSDDVTLDDASRDLNRMLNNRRSKPTIFKHQVGYVCKKEYTKDKGVHFHAFFFFDGQKILNSTLKAKQIGEYWSKHITEEKGNYHNCHRNDYKNNGIGMINHTDSDKRENLDTAISYLCKTAQDIAPIKENKNDRAFTRGVMPKSKGKMGRPRKSN